MQINVCWQKVDADSSCFGVGAGEDGRKKLKRAIGVLRVMAILILLDWCFLGSMHLFNVSNDILYASMTHFKYALHTVCPLYLNKAVFKTPANYIRMCSSFTHLGLWILLVDIAKDREADPDACDSKGCALTESHTFCYQQCWDLNSCLLAP